MMRLHFPSFAQTASPLFRSRLTWTLAGVLALSILVPGCETSRDRRDKKLGDRERHMEQMDQIDQQSVGPR